MTDAQAKARSEAIVRPEKPFNRFRWTITIGLLVLFFGTSGTVDVEPSSLLALPERTVFYIGLMFFPPDLGEVGRATGAMITSLGMAWVGTMIGAAFSFPLGFLAATNLFSKPVVFAVRQVLNFFRAVPEIVFLILFLPVTGLTPMTVGLALGISSIGTLGKLSAEVIESIDPGPVEAAAAAGGGRLQRIRWAVVPQVIPEIVALWLYRFEINIRNSAVAGAVGAGGIGTLVIQQISLLRDWAAAGTALAVMVGITLVVDTISGRLRRRIIRGPTRPVDIGAVGPQPPNAAPRPDPTTTPGGDHVAPRAPI